MRLASLIPWTFLAACAADAASPPPGGPPPGPPPGEAIAIPAGMIPAPAGRLAPIDEERWPAPARPVPGTFVPVGAGTFVMGAGPDDVCVRIDTAARHQVTLTRDFEIMDAEVTQADYTAVMGRNPSSFTACGGDCPAEMVDWHEAVAYCDALSAMVELPRCYECTGAGDATRCAEVVRPYDCAGYRLPTEAEWEHAYRAGTSSPIYNGTIEICGSLDPTLARIAWFLYNGDSRTHPVRELEPNAWGLFDMSGNVWEWTDDGYQPFDAAPAVDPLGAIPPSDQRVQKGGSYNCVPGEASAAHRQALPSITTGQNVGFRCARTLGP